MKTGLEAMLSPRSVAIVGATPEPGKLGHDLSVNLIQGGYPGPVYPINPKHAEVFGRTAYPSLEMIGRPVDLLLSAVGAEATIEVARACGRHGVKPMVAYAASFREAGGDGSRLERELAAIAAEQHLTILGPNTPGLINGHLPLNATFFPFATKPGKMAIATQSGGVGGAIYKKALDEDLSIGYWVGLGN